MKVHVMLKPDVAAVLKKRSDDDLGRYLARLHLENVDVERLRRHGIATGDLDDPASLSALKQEQDVEDVEVDSTQRTL